MTTSSMYAPFVQELALDRGYTVEDCYLEEHKGRTWFSDPGHGYLIITKNDRDYSIAKKILNKSGYGFQLDGAVALEEDCEAMAFLEAVGEVRPAVGVISNPT